MAAPHVAGAAALYLAGHPGASPAVVASHLTATATAMQGTDRLLLFTGLSVLTVRAPSADVVYGGAVPPGFPPTYVGLVSGESGPDTPATCTSTGHTGSAAGSYPITCAGAADSDYEIVYADGTLTVARAALDVRAPSVTVAYGTSVPMTFTPTYAGLVNGDTGSVTPATCTSTGHTGSPVGTYPITCSGASDPNYAIGYAAGTLTISRLGTVLTPSSLLSSLLRPTARLTRVDSGEGIAAQTIVFRAGTTTICSAVTSSVGVARCSRAVALATPLRAVYAGSPSYLPSSAPVPLA
jgi:hypothetical protein